MKCCLEKGLTAIGIDISSDRIEELSKGINKISILDVSNFPKCIEVGKLKLSSSFAILKEAEAVIICLPTPLTKQHIPDLSYIESSVKSIAEKCF